MRNIILIGYMGCGKSTVGKALCRQIKTELLDTDQIIEQQEKISIRQMFEQHGESYFRNWETQLLEQLLMDSFYGIISTGGGMPLKEKNRELLARLGVVIFLKASADTIYQRIVSDQSRPLLNGKDKRKEIETMLKERLPKYEQAATFVIETDYKEVEAIAQEILSLMNTLD